LQETEDEVPSIGDPSSGIPVSPLVQVRERLDDVVREIQEWKWSITESRPCSSDITRLERKITAFQRAAELCTNTLDCVRFIRLSQLLLEELKKMVEEPVPGVYELLSKYNLIAESHAYAEALKPGLKELKRERNILTCKIILQQMPTPVQKQTTPRP